MPEYGAVDTNEPDAETGESKQFRESTIYYLKKKPATKEECIKKALLVGFPILVAAILLGLFTSWIVHGTGIFSKGGETGTRNSDVSTSYNTPATVDTTPINSPNVPATAPAPAPAPKPMAHKPAPKEYTGGDSSCSANSGCEQLGLEGDCCPTTAGIMLGCC